MKLILVSGTPFRTTCIQCGTHVVLGNLTENGYADIEGEAFKAYYCAKCALPYPVFAQTAEGELVLHNRGRF